MLAQGACKRTAFIKTDKYLIILTYFLSQIKPEYPFNLCWPQALIRHPTENPIQKTCWLWEEETWGSKTQTIPGFRKALCMKSYLCISMRFLLLPVFLWKYKKDNNVLWRVLFIEQFLKCQTIMPGLMSQNTSKVKLHSFVLIYKYIFKKDIFTLCSLCLYVCVFMRWALIISSEMKNIFQEIFWRFLGNMAAIFQ